MNFEQLKTYELIEEKQLEDIQSICYTLKHKKSGAHLALISNDDENKVFSIAFRTPPSDSTGLPHILEHSVLCGSRNFPAKDPFVELVKGSLNTFLNAMTYPDKTVYPVASCNDKDFQNLMNVYMDAVFYPNIYDRKEIFLQEGWHYELEHADGELTYNGVVYNEMKGAFSSPEGVLEREIMNSLYPDTSYGVESGGDPKVIPKLSYEEFLEFHKKYYHPANSFIYLYGNMDIEEKLLWLDQAYLNDFEEIQVDSGLKQQEPFANIHEITRQYPITEEDSEENNTYLSFNKVIGTCLDKELSLAFEVLDYALVSAPGAPVRRAITDAGIGKDIISTFEAEILQPYFSIIVKNASTEQKEQFEQVVIDTLKKIVKDGVDTKSIEAAVNSLEFRFREADYGNYPKGLMYGLQILSNWIHDENHPFSMLELLEVYKKLRKENGTGYYEQLIQEYLIDNTHGCFVTVEPQKGMTVKEDAKIAQKLQDYKDSLSTEEKEELVRATKALKQYQEEPSSKEELEKIPMLKVSDIKREITPYVNEEKYVDDTLVLFHDVFTNGIGYIRLDFDTSAVPEPLIPYVGLLKSIYGFVDTDNYFYGEMVNEINCSTGGIGANASVVTNFHEKDKLITRFTFSGKALYEKMPVIFTMVDEMIHRTKLEDTVRIKEIIGEIKSRMQMAFLSAGNAVALSRAASYFSRGMKYSELTDGIDYYKFIKDLDENFEEKKEELVENLKQVSKYIFTRDNLMVDFTGEESQFPQLAMLLMDFSDKLPDRQYPKFDYQFQMEQKNEGFKTATQIQYVARCGDFTEAGLEYTGALRVLKNIMGYDYLWNQVRVLGGAYGCMSNFGRNGVSFFVSYRDPNLEKTMDVYEKAPEFLRNLEADECTLTKFVIGTISDMDVPLTPAAKGKRSYLAYLQGMDEEMLQKERDEVLGVTQDVIHLLADYAEAVLAGNYICVVGSEEKIEKQKDMFKTIETL